MSKKRKAGRKGFKAKEKVEKKPTKAKAKATKSKEKEDKPKKARKASPAFKLTTELAAVVGTDQLSRGEVTKKVWDYIKAHNLQDSQNKRLIRPDAQLAKVFGNNEPVDMFKLAGILGKHLIKE